MITVELWPHGERDKRRTIAVGAIANDGTGTDSAGSYVANFSLAGKGRKWSRDSLVKQYPRLHLNVWHLIDRALREALKR